MYCVFLFVILALNYFHRLQSIISEIFVLITLIIAVLYSPNYYSFDCNFFTRFFSIKDYLLHQCLHQTQNIQFSENFFQDDFYLRNYFLYQKNEIKATVYIYNVSTFFKTFFQMLSDTKVVDIREIHILFNQYPILKNLKFGQSVVLAIVKGHGLQSVLWRVSSTEIRIYNRVLSTDNFIENIIITCREYDRCRHIMIIGQLNDNFINSVRSLGLDSRNIQTIIHALEWQVNFQKLHRGDKFSILTVCSRSLDRKNFEDSADKLFVVAVRLHSFGKDYYAFRADNGRFYNRDAISMAGNFIRFPTLKQFRISSNFNLNRLNPITGRISPHFGVDFAVPIGTPVLSVGDGEVIVSKYGRISGNYIVIRHSNCCVTRYLHLNRLLVKVGQVVKKGDNIALSGNTGRSTGPHLHFEVWVNRKPVNPLTATFLNIERLSGCDRVNYMHQVGIILPYLHFN
ncbi:murein DD-endopeptidase MepM [Blochmannia endosymbiont of Polyrhachis (Hedomyrma) turneri]|uniref:murein DD-endopeptidase MepM n=1 Tax=Blochmannia endosymbiont of Polyrhachis (Hedomyrma) turneri TaxID=1505596 RepID=UPI00061A8631|nr:murein DD-endopeptidase MepM [Blochmannia endosymbiont of Polyrhachis (Hedomyrma) turneri]AKC60016.1 putative metalloprotease [Blochmannia endosymbiont of Polyrhachis (Hedomyrma) turneri]